MPLLFDLLDVIIRKLKVQGDKKSLIEKTVELGYQNAKINFIYLALKCENIC